MIYEFRCPQCKYIFEEVYKLSDIQNSFPATQCPKCMAIAKHIYSPPMTILDLQPYYDAGLGRHINSRQERKAAMKELGVIETGSEKPDYDKIKRKKQREEDKQTEQMKREAMKIIDHIEGG